MRPLALSALAGAVLVASCAASVEPVLSTDTVETGAVCAPTNNDGVTSIKFDLVRNITDGDLKIVSVEMASPHEVELVAAAVDEDLEGAHVGTEGSVTVDTDWAPWVLQPGEQAVVQVILRPTRPDAAGWTDGLWVLAETEQGERVRIHTCHSLFSSPSGACSMDREPSDEEDLDRMCGYSESV